MRQSTYTVAKAGIYSAKEKLIQCVDELAEVHESDEESLTKIVGLMLSLVGLMEKFYLDLIELSYDAEEDDSEEYPF